LDGGAPGHSNALSQNRKRSFDNIISRTGSAPQEVRSSAKAEGPRAAASAASGFAFASVSVLSFKEDVKLDISRVSGSPAMASSTAVLAPIHDPSGTSVADKSRKVLAGQLCLAARPRLQELPVQIRQNGIILRKRKLDWQDTSREAMLPYNPMLLKLNDHSR
jgi:hypothetical protein